MKTIILRAFYAVILIAGGISFSACEKGMSDIGQSLVDNEVTIIVDSLPTNLHGVSIKLDTIDARAINKLIGRINVPEYGKLECSFVTQLLCSTKMNIPDSITEEKVDSMCLIMRIPRGSLTGDSLTPQQLTVYRVIDDLPTDIPSTFDMAGKYDAAHPLGSKSYTVSNIALSDNAFKNQNVINVSVKLPDGYAPGFFKAYRDNNPVFQWPADFNKAFKGVYVEQNFGNGCIANLNGVQGYIYWHHTKKEAVSKDSTVSYEDRVVRDSVCILASQPEVLSSNNISYRCSPHLDNMVDQGKTIVTSPGGYITNIRLPIDSLLDRYRENNTEMAVVAALTLDIPAKTVENDYGLFAAPYLLMVKESERENFFKNNLTPDNISSFSAAYDNENKCYKFLSMRNYFLKILDDIASGTQISEEDMKFSLIPVSLVTESVSNGYSATTTYVIRCSPYIEKPSMTELFTENARMGFTFSTQEIK